MQRLLLFLMVLSGPCCLGEADWNRTGNGLGREKIRLAVPDFKPAGAETQTADLLKTFNDTLWNDLDNAGIFEMVSKSFYPLQVPANAQEMRIADWANPPTNAAMVAFGSLGAAGSEAVMQGWLYDVKNSSSPQILGKEYREAGTADGARRIAHRFADDIIFRPGGGIAGVAEGNITFVSSPSGQHGILQ